MLPELPAGSVRLGTTAFRFPKSYTKPQLTSDGRGFIAYDIVTNAYWCYELATGAPQAQLVASHRGRKFLWDTLTPTQQVLVFNENIPQPWELLQLPDSTVLARGTVPCCMATLSPDGRYVVEACVNEALADRQADQDMEDHYVGEVRVTDLTTQKHCTIKPAHNYTLDAHIDPTSEYVAITGNYTSETHDDETDYTLLRETVQIVTLGDGLEVLRLRIPRLVVNSGIAFVPGREWFVTHEIVKHDMRVIVIRAIQTGKVVQQYELGEYPCYGPIRTSPNGRYVAVCGDEAYAHRIDLATNTKLPVIEHPFLDMGVEPETRNTTWQVADDGTVQLLSKLGESLVPWTAPHGAPSAATTGHLKEVTAITFSPDGQTIRTAGTMSRVCEWDRSGNLVRTYELRDRQHEPLAVACFVNATTPLCIDRTSLTQYDLATEQFQRVRLDGDLGGTPTLNTARTHLVRIVSVEDDDGEQAITIRTVSLADGTERILLACADVQRVAATWCGDMLVVLTYQHTPQVRQLRGFRITPKTVVEVWSHTAPIEDDPDTDDLSGYVRPERPSRFARRFAPMWAFDPEIVPHPDRSSALVVPVDGMRLPFMVDVQTGQHRGAWQEPVRGPFTVHPTRDLVAVVHRRGDAVQLVGWRSGKIVQTVLPHAFPTALAWSPDGKTLAIGLPDTTVLLVPV